MKKLVKRRDVTSQSQPRFQHETTGLGGAQQEAATYLSFFTDTLQDRQRQDPDILSPKPFNVTVTPAVAINHFRAAQPGCRSICVAWQLGLVQTKRIVIQVRGWIPGLQPTNKTGTFQTKSRT